MASRLAMVAIALILVLSAVSVVATADTGDGNQLPQLGNYSFSDNTTTSTVYNLTYQTDNSNAIVANSIVTMGSNSSLVLGSGSDSKSIALKNVTVTSAGSENVLLFSTTGNNILKSPTMIFNLNTNVSKVNLTSRQASYLQNHSASALANFGAHAIYKLQVNSTTFFIFSNTDSALSGNTITYHNSLAIAGNKLIVAISSANGLKDQVEKELHHKSETPFKYNNTTGQLQGRFVSLQYNTTSGTISNMMAHPSNLTVFTQISASGNGSIGNGNAAPLLPNTQPIVVGSVFYYVNNTVVYQLHDNPSMVSNYFLSNGTLSFTVANGLNISTYNPPKEDVSHQNINSTANFSKFTNVDLGDQFDVQSSSTIVMIHNSSFAGSLFVHGANVSVNGSRVIITTNQTAHVAFVAPPGLQDIRKNVSNDLQYAIDHGRLAAVVVLGAPGQSSSNLSVNYNGSMQVSVQNVTSNKVLLKVSSKHHEGTNFAIFVPNNVIQNNSKISVKFDNQTITLTSGMNSVINATSTTQASFYFMQTSGGTMVVIHVPHFSTHSIEIVNSAAISGTNPPSLPNGYVLYLALGIVAAIAIIAGVALVRRKK